MRTLAATDMSVYSTVDFETTYTYEGDDLGAAWNKDSTTFRVWAPTADSVSVDGKEHEACDPYARTTGVNGQRAMVKKYIVDNVKYWADEYHMDGFRFDLVGLIDTETIRECMEEVHKTYPNVIFYGEGWTMSTQLTKEGYTMTTQANSTSVSCFAHDFC